MTKSRYDIDNRQTDTLFSSVFFGQIISMPNSDFYLLKGTTTLEEYSEERSKELKLRIYDFPITVEGYWMIGSSKTKKINKIGYKNIKSIVCSSGRHILFYKQDGNDYRMRVVSVKELVGE